MDEFKSGEKLYGDNFTLEQIENWYKEEAEGYSNIDDNSNSENYSYYYDNLNEIYGFKNFKFNSLNNVLGFGSAWGHEFLPIINKINNLTIIEPSEKMRSKNLGKVYPKYEAPSVEGKIKYQDNKFDLITCFGVLHHIPNVSFVLSELLRVLNTNGVLVLREPINSMGDWTKERIGLTKNERGIPVEIMDAIFKDNHVEIISKKYCFTLFYQIDKLIGKFFKKPLYYYKSYVYFDMVLSYLLKWNVRYFSQNKFQKIAPSSIFYVVRKK